MVLLGFAAIQLKKSEQVGLNILFFLFETWIMLASFNQEMCESPKPPPIPYHQTTRKSSK